MAERKHTIVCTFEQTSPHISAHEIHEWIHDQLQVIEHSVKMTHVDGTKRQVYINFMDDEYVQDILRTTNGHADYIHVTGEISQVSIDFAGMGSRLVRITNLPPEVPERTIRAALAQYGEIKTIQDETWSKAYRYQVANGIKVIVINLTKHLLSHKKIDGNRVLTSYNGQPLTCYGCGETGHIYQVCPSRHGARKETTSMTGKTWTQITANGPHHQRGPEEKQKDITNNRISNEQQRVSQM
jgi:hypothetical protein